MGRCVAVVVALLLLAGAGAVPAAGATADTVTLTVAVTSQAGDPVADATLAATWEGGSATEVTKANGKAFVDVPRGVDVEIAVEHPDFVRNRPAVVEDATEREVGVDVHRKGSLTVQVNGPDGGLADARVVVRKDGLVAASGPTDEGGRFETGTVEQGEYTVSAVKPGYFRGRVGVDVDGAARKSLTLEQGSVSYEVVVADPHFDPPRPVPGASVRFEGVGSVRTLERGQATVSLPVNTDVPLRVTKDGYGTHTRTLDVGERDERVEVSISRVPNLTVTPVNERVVVGERVVVAVTDEYGDPVANATVTVDGDSRGRTDADGELAVRIESAGPHDIGAGVGDLEARAVAVSGVSTATATPTATATVTDTPSPTPTATPTPASSRSAPGFSIGVTVLAALALAALAGRRRA